LDVRNLQGNGDNAVLCALRRGANASLWSHLAWAYREGHSRSHQHRRARCTLGMGTLALSRPTHASGSAVSMRRGRQRPEFANLAIGATYLYLAVVPSTEPRAPGAWPRRSGLPWQQSRSCWGIDSCFSSSRSMDLDRGAEDGG